MPRKVFRLSIFFPSTGSSSTSENSRPRVDLAAAQNCKLMLLKVPDCAAHSAAPIAMEPRAPPWTAPRGLHILLNASIVGAVSPESSTLSRKQSSMGWLVSNVSPFSPKGDAIGSMKRTAYGCTVGCITRSHGNGMGMNLVCVPDARRLPDSRCTASILQKATFCPVFKMWLLMAMVSPLATSVSKWGSKRTSMAMLTPGLRLESATTAAKVLNSSKSASTTPFVAGMPSTLSCGDISTLTEHFPLSTKGVKVAFRCRRPDRPPLAPKRA
mmetsp:Transcript_163/g.700  ORF Transcript_163/g.700 Transcript_163/m.700 type:complete len:270 (+) Transcript_163:1431-2240(+)